MMRVTLQFDVDRDSFGILGAFANDCQEALNCGLPHNVKNTQVRDWEILEQFSNEQRQQLYSVLYDIRRLVYDIDSICCEFNDYEPAQGLQCRMTQILNEVDTAESILEDAE